MLANALTLFYSFVALIVITLNYLKNPFQKSPLRLVPPAQLTDPKYGVHKYIKANVSYNYIVEYI